MFSIRHSWNFPIFLLLIKESHLTMQNKTRYTFPSKRLILTRETLLNTTVSQNFNQEHLFSAISRENSREEKTRKKKKKEKRREEKKVESILPGFN